MTPTHSRWVRLLGLVAAAALLTLGGCDDGAPGQGDVLPDGIDASDATLDLDAADTGAGDTSRPDTTPPGDTGDDQTDAADTRDVTDAADVIDPGQTLADYTRCTVDADCPDSQGVCVTVLPLNRPDTTGVDTVALSSVLVGLEPGQGVCTQPCSTDASACEGLAVTDQMPDASPWTCQLVFVGTSLYPEVVDMLPLADGAVDPAELAQGAAFGAICRPPVELDAGVDAGFCTACIAGFNDCAGDSACWNLLLDQPAQSGESGTCISPCDPAASQSCPLGFACESRTVDGLELDPFCWPVAETCGDCLDRDDDGHGHGRCGPAASPVSGYDCDDRNADIYFDEADPTHPFPTFCGGHDYNCNGLSDADEQIGSQAFGAEHCTACGEGCSGAVTNGARTCATAPGTGAPVCGVSCDDGWVDCDGDPSNGCEAQATVDTVAYYPDRDGDGYGDQAEAAAYACDGALAPTSPEFTYVADGTDCDDAPLGGAELNPGRAELCDGLDNDCDPATADGADEAWFPTMAATTACDGPDGDQCPDGIYVCQGGAQTCTDDATSAVEVCDAQNTDEDCDGLADDADPEGAAGQTLWYPDLDRDGYGSAAGGAVTACDLPPDFDFFGQMATFADNVDDCDDLVAAVNPGADETCATAHDDDCDGSGHTDADGGPVPGATTVYADADGDGYPLATGFTGCASVPGFRTARSDNATDCNDASAAIHPGAVEVCSTASFEDCSQNTDPNGLAGGLTFYLDNDGDGHGAGSGVTRCSWVSGRVLSNDDCDDANAGRSPSLTEFCDGIDNDCGQGTDEGCPTAFTIDASGVTQLGWRGRHGVAGWQETINDCPAGDALVGFEVYNILAGTCGGGSDGIWAVRASCADIALSIDTGLTPYGYSLDATASGVTALRGGLPDGALGCSTRIDILQGNYNTANQVVTRTWADANTVNLEAFRISVQDITVDDDTLPASIAFGSRLDSVTVPLTHASISATADRTTCPNGYVAVGFAASVAPRNTDPYDGTSGDPLTMFGDRLKGIALRCAPLELTL